MIKYFIEPFFSSDFIFITYFFWNFIPENEGRYEELKLTYFVFISSFIIIFRATGMLRTWEYKNTLLEEVKLSNSIKEQRIQNQILQNELLKAKIELAKRRLNIYK